MFNSATLLGRVGKKDNQTLKNGAELTMISVATNKKIKDAQGNPKEITTWHRVNCFGKLQEIANKWVNVGDVVFVRGEIKHTQVEHGEKSGQWMYNINAEDIRFIPKGNKDSSVPAVKAEGAVKPINDYALLDDDVMF